MKAIINLTGAQQDVFIDWFYPDEGTNPPNVLTFRMPAGNLIITKSEDSYTNHEISGIYTYIGAN